MGRTSNIASSHKYYNVTRPERLEHGRAQRVQSRHKVDRLALFANRACEPLAIHTGDFRLAGGVDFRHPKAVRLLETGRKLPEQPLRARVTMRLKRHQQPPSRVCLESRERRLDLGGMMPVIFDDLKT